MRGFAYSQIMEQPILVRGSFLREMHITTKPCFSPSFSLYMEVVCCLTDWRQHYSSRGTGIHILDIVLLLHGNFVRLCLQLFRGHFSGDAYNTETVLFTMFFAFVLYTPRNMTWLPIADETNRSTFWTSCTGVSWKRPFLCMMSNFGYSWLSEMQIFVGRVLHTGTASTLGMSYLGYFSFLSPMDARWTKGETIVQEKALCTCFKDPTAHETQLFAFWTDQTFVSGKFCFLYKIN